jgi:hypothetical protein
MNKILDFNSRAVNISDPAATGCDNEFDRALYKLLFDLVIDGKKYRPVLNTDDIFEGKHQIDLEVLRENSGLTIEEPSKKATNPERFRIQLLVRDFLSRFPVLAGLVNNNIKRADISIANAEILCGEAINLSNFIKQKGIINQVHRETWTRERDTSESQSGNVVLGNISENILKKLFDQTIDNINFFKVNQPEVSSYGDFVLMCLPNNLWLSVKSNYSRERLLASGFANDILGVGFFEDAKEFSSLHRVRNFQRAGFLAIYCPDIPVNEQQISAGTNTFDQVEEAYKKKEEALPSNINGRPFIRRLSSLPNDLESLLSEKDVRKRTTVKL